MTPPILVALVALLGTVWVALFQAWSARQFDRSQRAREQKREVFVELLSGISGLHAASQGKSNGLEVRAIIAGARCKIALFASPQTVAAVGALFDYPDLSKGEGQKAMVKAIRQMRLDVGLNEMPSDDEILKIVFGSGAIK